MCYDLYTVAGDLARLVTEQALRERFLPFYEGVVTFRHVSDGREQVIRAGDWETFRAGLPRSPKWRLQLRSGQELTGFDGMLASLLRWARTEGLLTGQGDRMRDEPRRWFRNHVAHHTYELHGPDHAERAIADVAHIISRLWGAPAGRPVHREVMLIAWTAEQVTWAPPSRFTTVPGPGELTCVLVRADPQDPGLPEYDAPYESTYYPCEWLWGPGTLHDALAWHDDHQPAGDQAETIDRLFLLQHDGDLLYIPRNPAVAAAVGDDEQAGTWYLIRADSPFHAFNHQRRLLAGEPGHEPAGDCWACPVETIVSGDLRQMLRRCTELGADVTPRPVPDVRVTMSRMPRCNRILGNGAWDIPRT